jgi:hypothetical protein
MEELEPRLALTWAGVPPTTVFPAALASPVTLNINNIASGSTTIASTEIDYYSFVATETGNYTISAITPSSVLDTVIGVFSSSGQRLAFNDNISSANRDSRLTMNLNEGTQYYLGVTNFLATSRGSYTWMIEGPTPPPPPPGDDAYENNDSRLSAFTLGTLSSIRTVNQLKLSDPADWFRFSTAGTSTSGSSVSINFLNSQGNLQLQLYSSTGALLATSAGTGNTESISLNGRAVGTYYVRVYGDSNATNPNYTMSIIPPTGTGGGSGFQISMIITGMTPSQQAIFSQAAARWSEVIVGDLPNATYLGQVVDDLLIHASGVPIDGVSGVLGRAGPDAFRAGSFLPIHGIMQFDTADIANMEANGTLLNVILHEMGHVLGVGTLWSTLGLLSGAATNNPIFIGAQATAAYNQIFGTSAIGVPVENTGGSGTRLGHWRETVFTTELMTGWLGPGTVTPMSRVTVAQFADLGYTVNLARADAFTPTTGGANFAMQSFSAARGTLALTASVDTSQVIVPSGAFFGARARANGAESNRRELLQVDASRVNQDALDAAIAAVKRPARADSSSMIGFDDESEKFGEQEFSLAWDDFKVARALVSRI